MASDMMKTGECQGKHGESGTLEPGDGSVLGVVAFFLEINEETVTTIDLGRADRFSFHGQYPPAFLPCAFSQELFQPEAEAFKPR